MTTLQQKLIVLDAIRQTYEQTIPAAYRLLFIRDVDHRIRNIKRAMDELPSMPTAGDQFDGTDQ